MTASKKVTSESCESHGERHDHNRANLHRIRRIQGQLESLARMLENDEGSCEERVVRARTIEKAMTSLINHLVVCYLQNTARHEMSEDPDKVVDDLERILSLFNR